jgi:hypothetical protein
MEKFIGKKVLITVAFGAGAVNAGSVPQKFICVLEKIDGEFLEFSNVQIEIKGFTSSSYSNYSNSAIINKQYLIMMVEA